MSNFKFGPEHVGRNVKHTLGGTGTITEINPDAEDEYMAMTIQGHGNTGLAFFSLEGTVGPRGEVYIILDEENPQPAPAPTIQEIADEISARMDEADKIIFRSETEEKLWLQCFTYYLGNTNAPEFADNAVLQYRARMPKPEPQAVRVEDAPPHMIAYSRLMEMGEVEAAKRIARIPNAAKSRWDKRCDYLHTWIECAFDWDGECEIAKGANIWGELYERAEELRIKMYPDGEE